METDRFDTLTRTIVPHLSRRGLAGLGLLAFTALGVASDTAARKKHRKHKRKKRPTTPAPVTCSGCTSCQTCVDGACQDRAEASPCGDGGACVHGVCALACNVLGVNCPAGSACFLRRSASGGVCYADSSGFICSFQKCAEDTDCPTGQACLATLCEPDLGGRCAPALIDA